jgi:hypothetical protein
LPSGSFKCIQFYLSNISHLRNVTNFGKPPFDSSWLRRRWNDNAVVIDGADGMEYQLTVDDINSSLVFMYTPVTDEGIKGEPQCTMTDFVKAGKILYPCNYLRS